MRIALDEIDPHIAALYAVTAPAHTTRATTTRLPRPRLSRKRRLALAAATVAPSIAGLLLALLTTDQHSGGYSPIGVWLGTWITGSLLGCWAALRGHSVSRGSYALSIFNFIFAPAFGFVAAVSTIHSGPYPPLSFYLMWLAISLPLALLGNSLVLSLPSRAAATIASALQTENMRDVFANLSLTRAERVYCDVLMFLARSQPSAQSEQTMRETLHQLNDLMASSRQLEEQRQSLLPLMGANIVPELRTEYDTLKSRLDAVSDPITRSSLEQSRRMVLSRIEDAHNLQTGLERLNTQQEAITQTLSSALSSLGRMQITSNPNAEFAMDDISQSVTQMNQQTVAVESAVEEVLTLRASG